MGKNQYDKLVQIIKTFSEGEEVGWIRLTKLIMKNIGSDERTIQGCLKTLLTTHLIQDIGNAHFKILGFHNGNK